MTCYRMNVRLLIVSSAVVALLGVSAHSLHSLQMRRHARGQLLRAELAEKAGDQKEQTASLGRSAVFDPTNAPVRTRHALLLADQAQTHRARQQALAALCAVLPGRGGDLGVRLRAADLALQVNAPDEACKLLRAAVAANPDRADLREKLATAQELAGKFADAADSLEKAVELEPDRVGCVETLSRLYRTKLEQPKRAAGVLERLVKRNPRLPGAYLARAKYRMEVGQLELAGADLVEARKLGDDADVMAASAELARRRGQTDESVRYWEQAVAAKPDRVAFTLGLARGLREKARTVDALETVQRGLAKNPDHVELIFLLADLLIDKGDVAEAARQAERLPATARGRKLYVQGRAALARRQASAAVALLSKANGEPDLPPGVAALALVRAYGELEQPREQALVARDAVKLTSDDPGSRAELARVLVSAGRGKEVLKELKELAALPAPPAGTWAALARVLIEENLGRPPAQRRWDEVDSSLAKADQVESDAVTAAILRADVLTFRDLPADALRSLQAARKARPNEPILWQAEATLRSRQGDPDAARRLLDEADKRFAERLDWLTYRVWRLVSEQGVSASESLEDLERKGSELTAKDRDGLLRALAQAYARIENYSAVERLCQEMLRNDPGDLQAALLLFDAKFAVGDAAGCDRALARIRKIEGEGGVAWRVGQASLLMLRREAKSLAEARELLETATKARPQWTHPLFLLARLDESDQKPGEALAKYQKVLALGDYSPAVVRRAVALLLAQDRDGDADRILEQAGRLGMLDADLLRPAAEIALRVGRRDRAAQLARLATPQRNPSYRDLLWLGRLLDGAGRTLQAEAALREATLAAPDVAETWLGLIAHHHGRGQKEDAADAVERMKGGVSKDMLSLALGRAYELLGRSDDAEQAYKDFLRQQPRDAEVLRRLADLYLQRNEADRAEGALRAMLDSRVLIPEEELPEIRRRLALVITTPGGRPDRSEEALGLLARNGATEGETEADRRVAALIKGLRPAERTAALQSLEALPGGPAGTALERLRLAWLYEAAGRWVDARKQYAAVLAAERDNPAHVALLIEGLLRQKKSAEAAGWMEKLEKLEPGSARVERFRAQVRQR